MKRTKIIATISDLKCDVEFLQSLYEAGVNVFRMNTAHQTPEDTLKAIKNMRKVSNKIPIIVDTKGPEIRTTSLESEPIPVKKGDLLKFVGNPNKKTGGEMVYLSYSKFHKDIPEGSNILYDDGEIEFKVVEKNPEYLLCKVQNSGFLKGKKSINVPGIKLELPSLTEKDKMYVEFSAKNNVDFIAHSFIRNKEDVLAVQKILDKHNSNAKIIAKIENQEGVDNIEEILDFCAGVMVARGDLAIEIPAENVPSIQKKIIKACVRRRKFVITATQMLHTMIENPRPTRAEISDIANAIYDGTDCVMLSGETAYGKYPLEAVKVMTKVAVEVEKNKSPFRETAVKTLSEEIPSFIAQSAVKATLDLPIKIILTDSLTGRTARYLSAFRGRSKIHALCYEENVMRELALSYGVYADTVSKKKDSSISFKEKLKELIKNKDIKGDDLVAIVLGSFGPTHGASRLEISKAENLIK